MQQSLVSYAIALPCKGGGNFAVLAFQQRSKHP
jgi:hypothetical protein